MPVAGVDYNERVVCIPTSDPVDAVLDKTLDGRLV